ncbi:MAG: hypothetical protein AB7F86_07290 [Bdellovibrionales bacterium]
MKDALAEFEKADWNTLVPLLLKHALHCVRQYQWKTTADALPEGQALEDLVFNAIQKTLEHLKTGQTGKGFRVWNPADVDLLTHLKGVVKSDVNTLVHLDEHKRRAYYAKAGDDQQTLEDVIESQPSGEGPDASAEGAKELYELLMMGLEIELDGDAVALKYLATVESIIRDGGDPSYDEIMKEGGLSFNDVKNSRRKVERAVARLNKELVPKGGKGE